ncbi:hypothetical protein C0J52_08324 [Blattella germanica]|nr:hypothetical protein C0J52_08324 [Blattella germanica]
MCYIEVSLCNCCITNIFIGNYIPCKSSHGKKNEFSNFNLTKHKPRTQSHFFVYKHSIKRKEEVKQLALLPIDSPEISL